MEERKERKEEQKETTEVKKEQKLSETWAEDALADLEDFIEEQGIHIRQ